MNPISDISEISEAKRAANQANAQHSTGPKTESGKTRSSQNAWRHGLTGQVALMPYEDAKEFNRFCAAIVADYHAAGPIETQLAQTIAEDYWRLNRARAWETNTLAIGDAGDLSAYVDSDHPQILEAVAQTIVFTKNVENFARMSLYEQRINRNIEKNEKRLAAHQLNRPAAVPAVPAQPEKPKTMTAGHMVVDDVASESTQPALVPNQGQAKPVAPGHGFVFSKEEIDHRRTLSQPKKAA